MQKLGYITVQNIIKYLFPLIILHSLFGNNWQKLESSSLWYTISAMFIDKVFLNNAFMEKIEFQLNGAAFHINRRNATMWVLVVPQHLLW